MSTTAGLDQTATLDARSLAKMPQVKPTPWGRWVLAVFFVLIAVSLILSVVASPKVNWEVVGAYFLSDRIMVGLMMTMIMSVLGMIIGVILGVILCLAKLSGNPVLAMVANGYIWFFRGIPLLVQMLVWGNLALLFPKIGIGIPMTDFTLFGIPTNSVITTFVAATLALALHEAAYMAEVVRSGINAVGQGQREAIDALGMPMGLGMRRIILPQAVRTIIPVTANQFITLLKASSMVAVIAGGDLLTAAQDISSVNYRTMELLFVASGWYLIVVTVLSIGQYFLEKRFSRGTRR